MSKANSSITPRVVRAFPEGTPSIDRRAMIGTAMALPLLPRAPQSSPGSNFIRYIAFLHPNGHAAATHAINAGMDPENLICILLACADEPDRPSLLFRDGAGRRFNFTPKGRVS